MDGIWLELLLLEGEFCFVCLFVWWIGGGFVPMTTLFWGGLFHTVSVCDNFFPLTSPV